MYVSVIYAFVADCVIFDESFTWVELLAAIIIFVVMIATSTVKLCESSQKKKESLNESDSFVRTDTINDADKQ